MTIRMVHKDKRSAGQRTVSAVFDSRKCNSVFFLTLCWRGCCLYTCLVIGKYPPVLPVCEVLLLNLPVVQADVAVVDSEGSHKVGDGEEAIHLPVWGGGPLLVRNVIVHNTPAKVVKIRATWNKTAQHIQEMQPVHTFQLCLFMRRCG